MLYVRQPHRKELLKYLNKSLKELGSKLRESAMLSLELASGV